MPGYIIYVDSTLYYFCSDWSDAEDKIKMLEKERIFNWEIFNLNTPLKEAIRWSIYNERSTEAS